MKSAIATRKAPDVAEPKHEMPIASGSWIGHQPKRFGRADKGFYN